MQQRITYTICFWAILLVAFSCESLDTVNNNNPNRNAVISSGDDLFSVLETGYTAWWEGIHGEVPVMAISVAADAYGLSWDDFGARRMGEEPRKAYNNSASENGDYKNIVDKPWYGCLSAVTSANDIILAMNNGVGIDDGGPQDASLLAAAHMLRGLSWGYLGLIFDQALIVDEQTNLEEKVTFSPYSDLIEMAASELEEAITLSEPLGDAFIHPFFNGLVLNNDQFGKLCHSYAARFLTQWPRTKLESSQVNWTRVLNHTEYGLDFNFAPEANGEKWVSYQKYAFAETGEGPFWARVDQRIIASMDTEQPARYPQTIALAEDPLANTRAQSPDARLETDFVYSENHSFPSDRGEWHYSHYRHNRNVTEPGFAGNGSSGPMPVFLATDNDLLQIEALLNLGRVIEAINLLNSGTRVTRGQLSSISPGANSRIVESAIRYERAIELMSTAPMGMWFDRRRSADRVESMEVDALGGLQSGTPAHLPVPAEELSIHGLPAYNFGGESDPEGIVPIF